VNPTILLLEDDLNLGLMLQEHLELIGFSVHRVTDGEQGLTALKERPADLCVVDVMMPRKDGFTFVRELRQGDNHTPVIFLTARGMKEDRIEGFKIGADDYVTKPFSAEELALRIKAVLRRTMGQTDSVSAPAPITLGRYTFDGDRHILEGPYSTQKLTSREAELLQLLCDHINRTLDRSVALKALWGDDNYFNGRSMDVFISRLRRRFQDDTSVEILNVHGKGYRLVVPSKSV
jgi:DNA-binding response OmpR family regulator